MAEVKKEYEFKKLGARLSNWGRWGDDDEIGTINFITPEVRKAAAALVKKGELFDLGMPFDTSGPQAGGLRFNPVHTMSMLPTDPVRYPDGIIVSDDIVTMPLQCATQWDGLAHVGYDGLLYNNTPAAAVNSQGASRNAFDKLATRFVTRGVLLDVAGFRGKNRLDPSEEITADDLDAVETHQGVKVRSGDVMMFRTGWYQHYLEGNHELYLSFQSAGLGISACEWLHDREVAAVAGDVFAVEALPAKEPGTSLPLHMVLIRDLGLTLGEMFNFEGLAADCNEDGVWEFLFSGVGLKVSKSVGSPISPVAIK
jgi:kynurenine formamidase